MLTEIASKHLECCITIGHCSNIQASNCVFYKILAHNKLGKKQNPQTVPSPYIICRSLFLSLFPPLLVAVVVGLFVPLLLIQCRPSSFLVGYCSSLLIDCFLRSSAFSNPSFQIYEKIIFLEQYSDYHALFKIFKLYFST